MELGVLSSLASYAFYFLIKTVHYLLQLFFVAHGI